MTSTPPPPEGTAADTGDAPPGSGNLDPALVQLCAVVVVGALAPLLDTTIVTVALAPMTREFGSSIPTVGWVVSGYLVAQAMVIPATGWLMERCGARAVWIGSLVAFMVGSVLCGLAWSAPSLIVFRVLQGLGGGALLPVGAAALTQAAGPHRQGRVIAAVSVPSQIAPIAGPLLGGLIADTGGWRWCFLVNVPVCLIAILLSLRVMAPTPGQPQQRLDVRGMLLLSPALGVVTVALSRAGDAGLLDPLVLAALGVTAALLVAFVVHALRVRETPLIDVRLYARRGFGAASAMLFLLSFSVFGAMVLVPLYYQQVRGSSALTAGLMLAPQFAGALLALLLVGRLADRMPPRGLVVGGTIVAVLGTVPLATLGSDPSPVLIGLGLLVRGAGFAATATAVMATAYRELAPTEIPRATSALQIGQRLGAPFGAGVLLLILQAETSGSGSPAASAAGFGATFWWAIFLTAPALLLAPLLPGGTVTPSRHPRSSTRS
jgi:EmrB/QacA subfamily drug resistance transporter